MAFGAAMNGLAGRAAIVTGGTGFLGSAIASRLKAEGAEVIVTSRDAEKANAWAAKGFAAHQLDLSSGDSIEGFIAWCRTLDTFPSILVCNASNREGLATPFDEVTHEHFSNLNDVDVAGHFILARAFAKALTEPGSIVFLSSIYAFNGVNPDIYPEGMAHTPIQYTAAKAAMLGVTRQLAGLWGPQEVRVNAIVAGGVGNPEMQNLEFVERYSRKTMLKRMALPDEIAAAVAFLASDDASYITGTCLEVDGGFSAW
jgi:NAD(P)-dependent dehydrogenase (short-subunit alcohol dehydrogenase family)